MTHSRMPWPVSGFLPFLALALFTILSAAAPASPAKEEPVGLLLTATGSKVLRASSAPPLAARAGDVLFSGDELLTESGSASFLYCPGKTSQTLDPGGDILLDAKHLRVKTGKLSGAKPLNSCFLPQLVRVDAASQQHYGVSMSRGLTGPDDESAALSALTADVRAQIEPLEAALRANPGDTAALVREAAIYDRNNLDAYSLATYKRIAAQWPNTAWVNGRIFELTESLQAQAARQAAAISADSRIFALLIGVSRYGKLPQDLWLRYADADAIAFRDFLSSPRGGAVPADRILLLTNEQATTVAVRNAFQTLLKHAGKSDTVFILLVGHGAADSQGAYILTYDSDPEDLSGTALKMADLRGLVDDRLSEMGRVVFLADVVHGAVLPNLKTDAAGTAVAVLSEAQGQMLGLLAGSSRETSFEGTEYGGGHGVFTYEVLKGLAGAADSNNDQVVDAGELADYVHNTVSTVTNRKQRPRDFGEIEPTTRLSDLTKPGIAIK